MKTLFTLLIALLISMSIFAQPVRKIDDLTDGKSDADGSSLYIGVDAGLNDDGTSNRNVGIGFKALYSNTSGHNNTANGANALYSNTRGTHNTANGRNALYSNTTGSSNTANGVNALYSNTTGHYNTANGTSTLSSNTAGSNNTANGYYALNKNRTGTNNTANGFRALQQNMGGNNNTSNGYGALYLNTTGSGNLASGYRALYNNIEGNDNVAIGKEALFLNTSGHKNTALGFGSLTGVRTGTNNIGIGFDAEVPNGSASNQVRIGNNAISYASIQVAWTITSDKHWKDNIRELPYGLNMVMQLQPVDYTRRNNNVKTREMGFIAQDLAALLAKAGYYDQGFLTKDDDGYLNVRYNDLIALLTKAIQEQQVIIDGQNSKINSFEESFKALTQRMEQLEASNKNFNMKPEN